MERDDKRLFDLVSPIVSENGLELKNAVFFGPKEFQAVWRMSGNALDMKISDYLMDAPEAVIEDFSRTVVGTIKRRKPTYGRTYLDWVTSDKYINSKRKVYLRRSRNLTGTPEGNERNLIDSLDRLLDSRLLGPENIDNSIFSWTKIPNTKKVGFCSPMMRVVGISCALDDVSVPLQVLDYVVYHESLHLAQGYLPGQRAHSKEFRAAERKYPGYEKAEEYLKSIAGSSK
jgi:hypothetical protein